MSAAVVTLRRTVPLRDTASVESSAVTSEKDVWPTPERRRKCSIGWDHIAIHRTLLIRVVTVPRSFTSSVTAALQRFARLSWRPDPVNLADWRAADAHFDGEVGVVVLSGLLSRNLFCIS